MKVYVLYDDPSDDGWNVYGIFSSEEKINTALKQFTPISNHELLFASFELDELEKFFDSSRLQRFNGYSPLHFKLNEKTKVEWHMTPAGLDSYFQDEPRKDTILVTNAIWLGVSAVDEADAIRKGDEMLKEIINQPEDERGWKWMEK